MGTDQVVQIGTHAMDTLFGWSNIDKIQYYLLSISYNLCKLTLPCGCEDWLRLVKTGFYQSFELSSWPKTVDWTTDKTLTGREKFRSFPVKVWLRSGLFPVLVTGPSNTTD